MPVSQARFQDHAPVLSVIDVLEAVDYYTENLGFQLTFQWADENEPTETRYAILRRDDLSIHLSQSDIARPSMVYFFVSGIKSLYRELKRRQAMSLDELKDQPWDMREFAVVDPDGNHLVFGESIEKKDAA